MRNYLRIMMEVSSIFLILSGTKENFEKKEELWNYAKKSDAKLYRSLRYSVLGNSVNIPGKERKMAFKNGI